MHQRRTPRRRTRQRLMRRRPMLQQLMHRQLMHRQLMRRAESVPARASSTSSSGRATPRAAHRTRRSTGLLRSRRQTGCMVNTTDMTDSNNGVSLMQSRQLRRHLGVRRRDDPPDPGRLCRARSTRASSRTTTNVFEGLKDLPHNTVDGVNYGVPHGRGAEPAHVQHRGQSPSRPTSWDPIWEGGADVRRQDQHLRLVDLHRRRRAAPHGNAAGPRHHRSLPAQPGAVRRCHRAARGAGRGKRPAVLGFGSRPDRLLRGR